MFLLDEKSKMWAGLLIVAVISIAFGIFVMYFRNLRDGVSTVDGYLFIFGTFIVLASVNQPGWLSKDVHEVARGGFTI